MAAQRQRRYRRKRNVIAQDSDFSNSSNVSVDVTQSKHGGVVVDFNLDLDLSGRDKKAKERSNQESRIKRFAESFESFEGFDSDQVQSVPQIYNPIGQGPKYFSKLDG